jgi:ribosomal silencing factor RsfS
MAKKDTDLLNDPLAVAQTRYREQVNAFKNQYLPKPKNLIDETLKQEGFDVKKWRSLLNG